MKDTTLKIRVSKKDLKDWQKGAKQCGYETFSQFVRDSVRGAVLISRNKKPIRG